MDDPGVNPDAPESLIRMAQERLDVLDAVIAAIDMRHEFFDIIVAGADSADGAVAELRARFGWTGLQAVAALEIQTRRFAVLEHKGLGRDRDNVRMEIERLSAGELSECANASARATCAGLTTRPDLPHLARRRADDRASR